MITETTIVPSVTPVVFHGSDGAKYIMSLDAIVICFVIFISALIFGK